MMAYHGQPPPGIQRKPAQFQPSIQPLETSTSYKQDTRNASSDVYKQQLQSYKNERLKV